MAEPDWDLLDWDCSSLSVPYTWADDDFGDGVSTISPAGQLSLFVDGGGDEQSNFARRSTDFGSLPDTFTLEVKLYHDLIGTRGDANNFSLLACQADEVFFAIFSTDGLEMQDTDSGFTEVGTDLVKSGGSKEWQTWRFLVTFTGTTGEGTCDVYLSDSTHSREKVGTAIPCSLETAAFADGYVWLDQEGYTTINQLTHVDYYKIATGLYAPGSIISVAGVAIGSIEKVCGVANADIEAIAGVSNTS